MANSDMMMNLVDAIAQGFFLAGTYKILFTKQRSLGQVLSMDTVQEGGKLALSSFVYSTVGQPVVNTAVKSIQGAVSK